MIEISGWTRAIVTAAAALALSGCYETHVPVITAQNALDAPLIANGRYCEATFDPHPTDEGLTIPAVRRNQCIELHWVAEGNGWRTDATMLEGDENGISIRVMRLGQEDNALGRSGLFILQAGPPPRQIALGGRSETVARAYIMGAVARDDMFALINAQLPRNETMARAREHGIGLSQEQVLLALHGAPIAGYIDTVGRWLAHELPREIYAAGMPNLKLEKNVIRIFVREGAPGTADDSPELKARLARMLDAVLFEAGVLDYELGLGLPAPRIDLASITGPAAPPARQAGPSAEQLLYNELMRCYGHATSMSTHLAIVNSEIVRDGNIRADIRQAARDLVELEQQFLDAIGPIVKAFTEPPFTIDREAALPEFEDGMNAAFINEEDPVLLRVLKALDLITQRTNNCKETMVEAEAVIDNRARR